MGIVYSLWKKGAKVIADNAHRSYDITAIAAITEFGPGYTLIMESNSITAGKFHDYMVRLLSQRPEEKQVFLWIMQLYIGKMTLFH